MPLLITKPVLQWQMITPMQKDIMGLLGINNFKTKYDYKKVGGLWTNQRNR